MELTRIVLLAQPTSLNPFRRLDLKPHIIYHVLDHQHTLRMARHPFPLTRYPQVCNHQHRQESKNTSLKVQLERRTRRAKDCLLERSALSATTTQLRITHRHLTRTARGTGRVEVLDLLL